MRIGIDVSQVVYGTGVGKYTSNLVQSLLKIDKSNEYVLFGGALRRMGELRSFLGSLEGNFEFKVIPVPPTALDFFWNVVHRIPIEKFTGKLDVYHSSDWAQSPSGAFNVTTIHDLSPIKFRAQTSPKIYNVHKRRLAETRSHVQKIIVPSESTRGDLIKLGFEASRICTIPEASTVNDVSGEYKKEMRIKYKTTDSYIVAVGINERKNTKRIIDAFFLATAGKGYKLVLIGEPKIKLEDKRGIRITEHISDKDYAGLLGGASALLYPSLYEGFGIPILDAFACGVPVVTSNISSMPEVAGKAAVLVDPYDVNSIAEGLKSALRRSKTLVKEGKKRIDMFSWEKTAAETLKVYNQAKNR